MLKFIWGKGQGPSAERVKIQKQLFGFSREANHGFPSKPVCFAFDQELKLLGVAAKGGRVLVYGQPGVELEMQLDEEEIGRLLFIPGQGRLIAVTTDNRIHLLEIGDTGSSNSQLSLVKSHHLEGRLKTVTALYLEAGRKRLVLGTEGGNIYMLRLWNMSLEPEILYQDQLVRTVPDTFRVNPGAVEAVLEHPTDGNRLLVGYTRGLVVLWDRAAQAPVHTFISQQQLESLAWTGEGQFVSSHNDGSYIVWDAATGSQLEPPNTPYGPYPCKAIGKFYGNSSSRGGEEEGNAWRIFAGGMPRASYGEKFTVTIMKNEEEHVVLDLASKIIDFLVIETDEGVPDSLLILSEEELVAVDLKLEGWPLYEVPYLHSVHASAITCLAQVTQVASSVMENLHRHRGSSGQQASSAMSSNPWPVTGGVLSAVKTDASSQQGLLLTGHEDGSVRFWGLAGNVLNPLAVFKTAKHFKVDDAEADGDEERQNGEDEEDEEWPPFRKVGMFDPYSDDPRLAVKKLAFCGESGRLVVGGTAGQVVMATLVADHGSEDSNRAVAAKVCKAEIVTEKEGFTWKGHQPLASRASTASKPEGGWHTQVVLQISPPASITALSIHREWGVLAAGTAHGFCLLDFAFGHVISARSTLNAQDIANADDNPMSRRKSLKKSLRESFRRLRKGRSQRQADKKKNSPGAPAGGDVIKRELRAESPEARPVERQIEARGSSSEDGLGSMVRCLHFAQTFITGPTTTSPTLWAGTNSGQVLIFLLNITPEDQRKNDKITAVLAKEIQLKHRAPVIDIVVFDSGGLPVAGGSQSEYPSPHKVLIASEEQFKVFLLPNLKPCGKYKLTAHEGARVRKVKAVTFASTENPAHAENCIVFLTNLGEISILAFQDLKRQVTTAAIRKEDVVGISSLVFSAAGDAVYMSSSSELQLLTVAATRVGFCKKAMGTVAVPAENRAASEEPATETDRQADLQNRQNEREAEQNGTQARSSPRSLGDDGGLLNDTHNETTISEASGDITLDSVKDHIVSQSLEISTVETAGGTRTERVETISRTVESVSVVRTQQILVGEVVLPPSAATAATHAATAAPAEVENPAG